MSDASQFNEPKIAVAVAFDEFAEGLVRFAGKLAARLGKKLVLLHVVEPFFELPISMTEVASLTGLSAVAEREARTAAESRLEELIKLVPEGVSAERVILHGKPRSTLSQSAFACRACLLIAGAHLQSLRHAMPRGLSTAMGLMPATQVPLLVVDPDHLPRLFDDDHKILLADDLTASSEAAVRYALELSTALESTKIRHVYINTLNREQLASALTDAAAAARSPGVDQLSTDLVFKRILEDLEESLEERASSYIDYLENSGGSYEREVITGDVRNEVAQEILRYRPTLVVFGRHKALHSGPMFLGRMPFRAMVAHGVPVLIVPTEPAA